MIAAVLVLGLCALNAAFVAGCLWATRGAEQPPPRPPLEPRFRRVARPALVARVQHPEADYIAIAADYIAPRADFDPSARAVLDTLVLVDALIRGKW